MSGNYKNQSVMDKNLFDEAKFGDHYIFDGKSDCIFLGKMKQSEECEPLYRLVACKKRKYKNDDGAINTEDILRDLIVQEDGFCWAWEDDNGQEHRVYVTKCV